MHGAVVEGEVLDLPYPKACNKVQQVSASGNASNGYSGQHGVASSGSAWGSGGGGGGSPVPQSMQQGAAGEQ